MFSTKHHPHVVVIGSGLGGLTTAVILAKNGYRVTVLEQENQAGGCLQCFRRRGVKFETGMHFIGSALPGQTLERLARYLEIGDDVKLSQLDTKQYNVIGLDGHDFVMGNGREAFIEGLAKDFPAQRDALNRYYALVQKVAGASSLHSLRYAESDDVVSKEYLTRSVNEVIDSTVSDPLLANVLVGDLPLYAAEKDKTPFATHAFIRDFYDQSAFRVIDGSDHIAQALIATLQHYGGEVLTGHRVTRILCDATQATGVEVNGEKYFDADYIISDAHPIRTLELIDSPLIRPAYRHRVNAMPQTVGCFTLYLDFKPQSVPYMNYNYFGYQGASPWGSMGAKRTDHLLHEHQRRAAMERHDGGPPRRRLRSAETAKSRPAAAMRGTKIPGVERLHRPLLHLYTADLSRLYRYSGGLDVRHRQGHRAGSRLPRLPPHTHPQPLAHRTEHQLPRHAWRDGRHHRHVQ